MTPTKRDELNQNISSLLEQFQVDAGTIKIKPSTNWVALLIQIFALIAAMAFAYGKLDGRLVLIEYRLAQIEKKVDNSTTVIALPGTPVIGDNGTAMPFLLVGP